MVSLMLAGFGGDWRHARRRKADPAADAYGIQCYHVNARLSRRLSDIGDFHVSKLLLLLLHCLEAVYVRFRHGVKNFYYIPAPGKRFALYRDWLVMLICRPFFDRIILHWHGAGLARWLETCVQMRTRVLTWRFLKHADLSIVLSEYNRADAEKLLPRRLCVVTNGIPDPCPHFETAVLPRRRDRLAARKKILSGEPLSAEERARAGGDPHIFKVLYLAHCTREKGLFDTIEALALANGRLHHSAFPIRLHLTVAGEFVNQAERREFEARIARADLWTDDPPGLASPDQPPGRRACVTYAGFVTGEAKDRLMVESDCFCFPTYFYAENLSLVILEAMAFGMLLVTTRWRSMPELFPPDYPGLVDIRAPDQIARTLLGMMTSEAGPQFRQTYLTRFTLAHHLGALARAIRQVEAEYPAPVAQPALATAGGPR